MIWLVTVTAVRRSIILAAFVVPFGFTPSSVFASAEQCTELFRIYGDSIADRLARQYRWRLQDRVFKELLLLREARAAAERKFAAQLMAQQNVRSVDVKSLLHSSHTLSGFRLQDADVESLRPPAMRAATVAKLHDARASVEELRQALSADPYAGWLALHASKEGSSGDQFEPLELVFRDRAKGVPGEVAFLRVQRTYDTTLSPEHLRTVDQILEIYAMEIMVMADVLEPLKTFVLDPPAIEAWRLSTSFGETRSNLRALLNEQVQRFAGFVSRAEYERLLWDVRQSHSDLSENALYREHSIEGHRDAETPEHLKSRLSDLRRKYRMKDDFQLHQVFSLLASAHRGASYEEALTNAFASKETRETIAILRRNDEIGEAFRNTASARAYLHELQAPHAADLVGTHPMKMRF